MQVEDERVESALVGIQMFEQGVRDEQAAHEKERVDRDGRIRYDLHCPILRVLNCPKFQHLFVKLCCCY